MSSKQINILNDLENLVSHLSIQMAILIWLFAGANDNFNFSLLHRLLCGSSRNS